MKNSDKSNIIEVFSSIQGEGPYIGHRQIFVRFAGCNLSCNYCDTDFTEKKYALIEQTPGHGDFKKIENFLDSKILVNQISNLNKINHHSLSLTGGEPLLHTSFLEEFIPLFKKENKNIKIYLETNGTLPKSLNKIIKYIDIISMDIKLESSTGIKLPEKEHDDFIQTALNYNKELFVKAVLTSKFSKNDEAYILKLIQNNKIPVILQPVSTPDKDLALTSDKIMEIQNNLLSKTSNIRVIPQVHKFMNVL